MMVLLRALRFIWARFCEYRAKEALDAYMAMYLTTAVPSPNQVRAFERRTAQAWQRHENWRRRAEKNFSKLGVKR